MWRKIKYEIRPRNRKITTLYLKTDLRNYYEKFGAIYVKELKSGERLYKFEL